jgi:hypothetical protein
LKELPLVSYREEFPQPELPLRSNIFSASKFIFRIEIKVKSHPLPAGPMAVALAPRKLQELDASFSSST